jgi:tetratricopeptide (TPR) repeat protein
MIRCLKAIRNRRFGFPRMASCIVVSLLLCVLCASRQVPIPDRTVASYGQNAALHFKNGEFTSALRLYGQARSEAMRLDIPQLEARYLFNIGRIFFECNRFDSALNYFSASRSVYQKEKSIAEAATAGVYEALSKAYLGNIDSAQTMFKYFSSYVPADDTLMLLTAEMVLALLQGAHEKAFRLGDRALSQLNTTHDHFSRGNIYYYAAMAAFVADNRTRASALLDSSLYYFERAPWRYRNWKPLLGKAILAFCENDTLSGMTFFKRAENAAPPMLVFPNELLVRKCPSTW